MKTFKEYLKENKEELAQMITDFIETAIQNNDKENEARYKDIYLKKIGKPYEAEKEFSPKPSIDKIYSQNDFKRYQDYIKYCDKLYILKFKKYGKLAKGTLKTITSNELKAKCSEFGVNVIFAKVKGTEEASVQTQNQMTWDIKYLKKPIPVEIWIHEMGHIFEYMMKGISSYSPLFLHNMKTSEYDLKPLEIFAESFKNYIVNPKYLKAGWPEVYDFFKKNVPTKWIKTMTNLI